MILISEDRTVLLREYRKEKKSYILQSMDLHFLKCTSFLTIYSIEFKFHMYILHHYFTYCTHFHECKIYSIMLIQQQEQDLDMWTEIF